MASQTFNPLEMKMPQPFMLRDILPGPAWAPYQPQAWPSVEACARPSDRRVAEGNCVRGLMIAFALECTVALSIFGVWHLWHMIR